MAFLMQSAKLLGMLLLLGFLGAGQPAYAETQLRLIEQKIKAGLLYNFIRHTTWPTAEISDGDTPSFLTVCVYGDDPFEDYLRPMEGRTVNQKKLFLERITTIPEAERCSILFVSESQKQNWAALRHFLQTRNVMTVSDFPGFAQSGGMVEFYRQDNHISTVLNLEAFGKANLHISESLLDLQGITKLHVSEEVP